MVGTTAARLAKNRIGRFAPPVLLALTLVLMGGLPLAATGGTAYPAFPLDRELLPQTQADAVRFRRLSVVDGLSQSTVTAVLQDQRGFMWFGTEAGLNRYDGYQFRVFKRDPGDPGTLSNNTVNVIYVDQGGDLWIGTDGGLDRLDRAAGEFVHWLEGTRVSAIGEDGEGTLWIGTEDELMRYDRAAGTFTHYEEARFVRVILRDRAGDLWIGTDSGLVQFDRSSASLVHYRRNPSDTQSLSSDAVRAIHEDRQGTLWIGTDGGGLNKLDRSTRTFAHYRHATDDPSSIAGNRVQAVPKDSRASCSLVRRRSLLMSYTTSTNIPVSYFTTKGGYSSSSFSTTLRSSRACTSKHCW